MTVLPGSLDNLYYKGILDHIPYEAYEMMPMTQSAMMESAGMGTMQQMGMSSQMGIAQPMGMMPQGGTSKIANLQQYTQGIANNTVMNGYNSQITNGTQYIDMAKKGEMYGNYGNSYDSFSYEQPATSRPKGVRAAVKKMLGMGGEIGSNYNMKAAAFDTNNGIGDSVDFERMANDQDGQNLRVSVSEAASSAKEGVMNSHPIVKGLLSVLIVAGTLALAIKGLRKKSPVQPQVKKSFWSKLNPLKWGFWSKLNPVKWFKKK